MDKGKGQKRFRNEDVDKKLQGSLSLNAIDLLPMEKLAKGDMKAFMAWNTSPFTKEFIEILEAAKLKNLLQLCQKQGEDTTDILRGRTHAFAWVLLKFQEIAKFKF